MRERELQAQFDLAVHPRRQQLEIPHCTPHRKAGTLWSLLAAWRITRLPWMRFGLLALIVAWASVGSIADVHVLAASALAFGLIAQFRLWDDLADRTRDRVEHPERVLARIDDVRLLVGTCIVLGGINAMALFAWQGSARLVGLAMLSIGLSVWYALHPRRGTLHTHVLLLKYPVFVLLLAGPHVEAWTLSLGAASVYAAMCSYELLDAGTTIRMRRLTLAAHGCVLTIAACAPAFDAIGLAVALLVASIHVAVCFVSRLRLPGGKYVPLAAAVIVLVRLSIGSQA